jgi:hypothetical protein
MTIYHFTIIVGTEVLEAETPKEFGSMDIARHEARALLGRLASAKLAIEDCEMISVEILDVNKVPLTELRLAFQEIAK